jgi:hypothetical protein
MPTVTVSRIMDVHATLNTTVNKTNEYSTLSPDDQDKRLAQSCAEVCALLEDWLVSEVWRGMCPSGDQSIDDFLQDQEHLDSLLPTLKDVLDLASRHGMTVPHEYVDQAREALRATAKLFKDAEAKVIELRCEVCKLAGQLRDLNATPEERADAREKADRLLEKVFTRYLPVLAVVIAVASVNPSQVASNAVQWIQVFNRVAVQVIADRPIQDIAGMADPQLSRQGGPHGEAPHIRPVHGPATIPRGAQGAQAVPARPQGEAPYTRPVPPSATRPRGAQGVSPPDVGARTIRRGSGKAVPKPGKAAPKLGKAAPKLGKVPRSPNPGGSR